MDLSSIKEAAYRLNVVTSLRIDYIHFCGATFVVVLVLSKANENDKNCPQKCHKT